MTEDNHNDQEENNQPVRKAKTGAWWKSVPQQLAEIFTPTAPDVPIPAPSEAPTRAASEVPSVPADTSRQEQPEQPIQPAPLEPALEQPPASERSTNEETSGEAGPEPEGGETPSPKKRRSRRGGR